MGYKGDKKNTSIVSALITLIIVSMLILSGPVQAVSVIISGLQGSYTQGSIINFQIKIEINDPDKFVPITNISLDVNGSAIYKNRIFALDGTPLSGDSIISITPVSIPQTIDFGYGYGYGYDTRIGYGYDFGYGYGYGYQAGYGYGYGGQLTYIYNVSIDTASLPIGGYDLAASLNTGNAGKPSFNSAISHFTITPGPSPPGGSSGGSTGGGGIVSSEPVVNIIKYEVRCSNLRAGTPVSFKFTEKEHWITEIIVMGKENEDDICIRAEALKGPSKQVLGPVPGEKNINLWAGTKKMQESLIRFEVENSWIITQNFTAEQLRMYRYDGSKWNELETRIISQDVTNTYFESRTFAFSPFTIGVAEVPRVVETPVETPVPSASDVLIIENGSARPKVTERVIAVTPPEVQKPINPAILLVAIIVIVIIVGVFFLSKVRKK